MKGKVYLIGAGPGDPGLITVKGLERLKQADVVLYDRLIPRVLLSQAKKSAFLKYTGKEKGDKVEQRQINQLLLNYARDGKCVARLKGGDPFIFGRGQEEMLFLKNNGIECEVIPGVSSCYAVAEACGIPLTYRGIASGFLVVTGHEDPQKETKGVDWQGVAKFPGTIVIMMGLSNLQEITAKLIAGGKNPRLPAALISYGTTKKQKVVTGRLADIAQLSGSLAAPAVCVLGDVVKVGFSLNAAIKPLAKKRYLATASVSLNRELAKNLQKLGAKVQRLALTRIVPNKETGALDAIIDGVRSFDWLVFTSRHGAHYFLKRYFALKKDKVELSGRIACVGSGTAAEFARHDIGVELMPEKFTTLKLARTLAASGIKNKKIALLRTKVERDFLKKILVDAGATVIDCLVYNVQEALDKKSLAQAVAKKPDGIFFLSPKSTRVFFDSVPLPLKERIKNDGRFFSIGPVTTQALRRQGAKTVSSAREHTVQGLVDLCLEAN